MAAPSNQQMLPSTRKTLSGASGKHLKEELAKWMQERWASDEDTANDPWCPQNVWERWESGVATYYDRPFGPFFNFFYDVLQFSSGRDKLCSLVQGYAKFASAALSLPDSERHWMYRGIEDNLSDGRKIFRLFKEHREVYKIRRGFSRLLDGISEGGVVSIPAACGFLDICGHCASFTYYLFDNVLWAASVGIFRSKEVPKWQQRMWKGFRRNGPVIERLGGVSAVKFKKNSASIYRLVFAITANLLLLKKALETCSRKRGGAFQGPDDPRLFHTIEIVGMVASFRILLSKLEVVRASHARLGLLAILSSVCGIWTNWRKVRRKKCGTKYFETAIERRKSFVQE